MGASVEHHVTEHHQHQHHPHHRAHHMTFIHPPPISHIIWSTPNRAILENHLEQNAICIQWDEICIGISQGLWFQNRMACDVVCIFTSLLLEYYRCCGTPPLHVGCASHMAGSIFHKNASSLVQQMLAANASNALRTANIVTSSKMESTLEVR